FTNGLVFENAVGDLSARGVSNIFRNFHWRFASGGEYNIQFMRIFRAILIGLFVVSPCCAQNLVLLNGTVIDGSGKPRALANVRIRDGKISDLGPFKPTPGETVLDVKGMIIAPGFIDLRSLSPSAMQKDP